VIGLIFITAIYPVLVVSNLILFLSVALVAVFVVLLIWGFIFTGEKGFQPEKWMKWVLWILGGVAFIAAIFWATGWYTGVLNFFMTSGLNQTIITNIVFVVVIAIALVLILKEQKKS
jgi:hypothetical protein